MLSRQIFVVALLSSSVLAEDIVLNPDIVVKRAVESSRSAEKVRLDTKAGVVQVLKADGRSDLNLRGNAAYVIDRSENLSGLSSLEDKQLIAGVGLDKKFYTGTKVSTSYQRIIQRSDLTPALTAFRSSSQAYDDWQMRVEQDLLKNIFGVADRYRLQSAELQKARLDILENESLEAVGLEALSLFLATYVAEQKVKETEKAFGKYKTLAQFLSDKVGRGLGDQAEVGKAKAQLGASERAQKVANLDYENKRAQLISFLQLGDDAKISLSLDEPAKHSSVTDKVDVEGLERVRAARLFLEAAEKDKRAARWESHPEVKGYGSVALTGVDKNSGEAFSEMISVDKPRYEVGLQLQWSPLSSKQKADQMEAGRLADIARVEASRILDAEKTFVSEAKRNLETNAEISKSAEHVYSQWDQVLKDQERRFRRGIISLNEMIQDYNSLFQSEAANSSAKANYLFSHYQWKAVTGSLLSKGITK